MHRNKAAKTWVYWQKQEDLAAFVLLFSEVIVLNIF